ncbi:MULTISPECIES: T9SS type A sorting domain-containing protein [unclassified Flavobacterium]|uniref:T9SS type A sorting domain-containing protein n=1 Tax=unclassified Flavobacterium TaxID=196869 RepID=UPI001F138733|nr:MULTISPECIES: T9SS type A sorting domain-containing protein [unclassified Flavobacterium]UMY66157.1 T9SS type A sorting domain-containing protein [Flavobacterium sp. HJ-32-4]
MKKLYYLILLPALMAAQVPNPGFEQLLSSGQLRNWGYYYTVPVTLDPETGESSTPQIDYAGSTSFATSTPSSHGGLHALSIRNARFAETGEVIPGRAELFDDTNSDVHTGWNAGRPVEPGTVVDRLAFYYRFNALNGEVGQAELVAIDGDSNELAQVSLTLSDTAGAFLFAETSLNLPEGTAVAFVFIRFRMAGDGETPAFGSELVIDDLAVNAEMLQVDPVVKPTQGFYPNPTEGKLFTRLPLQGAPVSVVDMAGRRYSLPTSGSEIDASALSPGVYLWQPDGQRQAVRFIRK